MVSPLGAVTIGIFSAAVDDEGSVTGGEVSFSVEGDVSGEVAGGCISGCFGLCHRGSPIILVIAFCWVHS